MLRVLALVAIGAALYSSVLGSAATIQINAGSVQQGADDYLICSQSAAVTLTNSDADPTELDGATVTVNGCNGAHVWVSVYGPDSSTLLGTCTTSPNGTPITGGVATCTFAGAGPSVLNATSVTVQVIGGASPNPNEAG